MLYKPPATSKNGYRNSSIKFLAQDFSSGTNLPKGAAAKLPKKKPFEWPDMTSICTIQSMHIYMHIHIRVSIVIK